MYYILDKDKTPYQTTVDQVVLNLDKMKNIQEDKLNDGTSITTTFLFYSTQKHEGKPLLFNTKVTNESGVGYSELYKTYDEAIDGHNRVLNMYKQNI
jgi:hypothetical protein